MIALGSGNISFAATHALDYGTARLSSAKISALFDPLTPQQMHLSAFAIHARRDVDEKFWAASCSVEDL